MGFGFNTAAHKRSQSARPLVAGLILTGVVYGRAGLRNHADRRLGQHSRRWTYLPTLLGFGAGRLVVDLQLRVAMRWLRRSCA